MKLRIRTAGAFQDVESDAGDWSSIGIFLVDDDDAEHPLVWVDDFYREGGQLGIDDGVNHDATIYVHLASTDPKSVIHFSVPEDSSLRSD